MEGVECVYEKRWGVGGVGGPAAVSISFSLFSTSLHMTYVFRPGIIMWLTGFKGTSVRRFGNKKKRFSAFFILFFYRFRYVSVALFSALALLK